MKMKLKTISLICAICFFRQGLNAAEGPAISKANSVASQTEKTKVAKPKRNSFLFEAISWIETGELTKTSDGSEYSIRGISYGAALGYRKVFNASEFNFVMDLELILGQSNHQNKNTDISYKHSRAAVAGGLINFGVFKVPTSGNVTIGLSAPIIARTINYVVPSNQFEFKTKQKIISYLALDVSWKLFENLSLNQQFGSAFENQGNLWKFGLAWIY